MYPYSKLIYVVFLLSCFILSFYSGKRAASTRTTKEYWKACLPAILLFSSFYGLRFGRLVDYNLYFDRYTGLGKSLLYSEGIGDTYEFGFAHLCHFLAGIGVPYQLFIFLCALLFILSLTALLRPYKQSLAFSFPILYFYNGALEMLIRWCLGVPFLLLAVALLERRGCKFSFKTLAIYAALSLAACSMHSGLIVLAVAFYLLSFVRFTIKPVWIFILILITEFVASTQIFLVFSDMLRLLNISDRAEFYIDRFDDSMLHGFKGNGLRVASFINKIKNIVIFTFPLYLTNVILRKYKVSTFFFNIWALGVILQPLLSQAEILDRMMAVQLLFMSVVLAPALHHTIKNWSSEPLYVKVHFVLCVGFIAYTIIRSTIEREWFEELFIWDADGRDTLPVQLFIKNIR